MAPAVTAVSAGEGSAAADIGSTLGVTASTTGSTVGLLLAVAASTRAAPYAPSSSSSPPSDWTATYENKAIVADRLCPQTG